MNRKEKVLAYIQSDSYVPLTADEIAAVLDVPKQDTDELAEILNSLCGDGRIFLTKRGRYVSVDEQSCTAAGILSCNPKGYFGFVVCEDGDIYINGDHMKTALNGDRVLVRYSAAKNGGKREGHVINVLERGNDVVAGVIYKEKNGFLQLRPDNRRIYTKLLIPADNTSGASLNDRVAVKITEYGNDKNVYGEILSVLGNEHDLKSCVESIIIENHIKQEFDAAALDEASLVPDEVRVCDGREDFRDKLIFTVDGDDARDFDDAVSLEMTENNNYLLGVHIADVSEYVGENSALDREAYERGTSVYLADRVIPMLPERLSNGICSLNPDADRLTLSLLMEISPNGEVTNHRLTKTVIRSSYRMTYNNVNAILESGDSELCRRYGELVPTLQRMERLATILYQKREKRGAIQFDFPESHIVTDDDGYPIDIQRENRGVSNKMIEEFMLLANETIAEYAFWSEIPFIYRNHEPPSEEKIAAFNSLLLNFGLSVKGKIDKDNPVHPKALQQILDKVKGTPAERVVSRNMLQSLMKARYSSECLGHFGLSAKYYCHFTSPIRRYPDLAIHRILKKLLDGSLSTGEAQRLNGIVSAAAPRSSEREINAEQAERDTDDLMKAVYMSSFTGERFEGIVSGITSFGMFIELNNSIEGLVRLENMTDDYYEYDELTSTLTGKRKKRIYAIGDTVGVIVAHTDMLLRQIDFVLERDYNERITKKFSKPQAETKRQAIKKTQKRKYYRRKRKKHG